MAILNVQALIDQKVQSGGGTVTLPVGTYDCEPFIIPDRVVVEGAGASYGSISATVLRFAAGTSVCAHLAGVGAQLRNVAIQGPSFSVRAKIGVRVSGHASLCHGVSTYFMTDFGFYVSASSADQTNANNFALWRCRAARCGRAGYYVNGAETNAGRIEGCTADGNEGWGFFESSFLGNEYSGCHASNNVLGNYAQGGSIDAPLIGGVSNYSTFVGCYTEGSSDCPFRAAQIHIDGGNLQYQVSGWPTENGVTTPFPGTVVGFASRLRFVDGPIDASIPSGNLRALASIKISGDSKLWCLVRSWFGSPSWLANTIALFQHDKSGWEVPFAATREAHPAGPGRRVYGAPFVNTPFRFVVRKSISLPSSPDWQIVELAASLLVHDLPGLPSTPVVRLSFNGVQPSGVVEIAGHYEIDLIAKKLRVYVRAVSGGAGEIVVDVERVSM